MKNMIEKLNAGVLTFYVKTKSSLSNERGVTTVEWVGLAAVILALMFIISSAMSSEDGSTIAQAIVSKIRDLIGNVSTGGGS